MEVTDTLADTKQDIRRATPRQLKEFLGQMEETLSGEANLRMAVAEVGHELCRNDESLETTADATGSPLRYSSGYHSGAAGEQRRHD